MNLRQIVALKNLIRVANQPSTGRGIVAIATATGLVISPEDAVTIIATGLAIIGAIGAFIPDTPSD